MHSFSTTSKILSKKYKSNSELLTSLANIILSYYISNIKLQAQKNISLKTLGTAPSIEIDKITDILDIFLDNQSSELGSKLD